MPALLNRFELAKELERIIEGARHYLILISPYFKLNDSLKRVLSVHKADKEFTLVVVYGKNEDDKSKSLSDADLEFFKGFENVEIRYHKRLHAKIYLNEDKCLITSLNLHDYSLKENIEVGILTKSKALDLLVGLTGGLLPDSLDSKAADFADYIVEKSTLEFKKELKKKKAFFGLITKSENSVIEVNKQRYGYCIRTGEQIAYNVKSPFCAEAWTSWSRYRNYNYTEKYCHGYGKPSGTSMGKPLCPDCSAKS